MERIAYHLVLLLVLPPILLGVVTKVKAFFAGRRGPPVMQPWFDLVKLAKKSLVLSTTTSPVFLIGPAATLAGAIVAGLFVPVDGALAVLHFRGDLFLLVGLLAVGRILTVLAALDTGSAFEGMGAARETTFACFAEPALMLGLLAISRATGSIELSQMFGSGMSHAWISAPPTLVLVLLGLFLIALLENCRIPFDDPNTHLELTMIHEVMVLDHGGPALGIVLYGAAIKLFVFAALVARMIVPVHTGRAIVDALVFACAVGLVAVIVGVVESVMARLRLVHVSNLLIGACLLTGFGFLLL